MVFFSSPRRNIEANKRKKKIEKSNKTRREAKAVLIGAITLLSVISFSILFEKRRETDKFEPRVTLTRIG